MTTEEQRKQNRERQQRHREKKRQAAYIPTAEEDFDKFPEEQGLALRDHVRNVQRDIKSELGVERFAQHWQDDSDAEYAIDAVARTLFAFKKGWMCQVSNPDGLHVAGTYFPDALGAGIVDAAHRYSLERSQTFSRLYRELLEILDNRFGKNTDDHAKAIKAEIAGTYVLKLPETRPEPKPEVSLRIAPEMSLSMQQLYQHCRS